jgi:ProP effector
MTTFMPTKPVAPELVDQLSKCIDHQQRQLTAAQQQVKALRQEHHELKQQQALKQIPTDDIMTSTSEEMTLSNPQVEPEATPTDAAAPAETSTASKVSAADRKKAKSRAANRAAVELLCETYPQTFAFAKPRPLKIGIQEELVADGKLSQTKIKRGLASYVRAFGYLKSQTDGAPRINLLGEADGAVTADEAAHALTKLPAPRKPSKPRADTKKRPARAHNKPKQQPPKAAKQQAKVEKAPSPFDGLNDGQRMASKLDLLMNKHK